ncbi:MAG: RNA polymerase sigma factor RpoE [Gammaproteobacteria bacterium]|jgi:RNA polymerase sigma-70 factor (ECF subfamily)|nr:RNA polymerase sigma factor RpoE [Gammaproteobacteria bacterium]
MSERAIDQELVVRVQQGDKKAFDLLVLKYQLRLSKLVSRFLRNQSDVPDVVQEAFIKAYRALPNFRGESAFYTWLYRIAINTAKNHLVSQSRKSPVNSIDVQDAEDYGASEWLKEYASPEREALASELESTIYMAIDDLPSDLREAITLREIEGLSYEDIAAVMDCPIGTVRSRIFRAREAIEDKLEPILDDDSHHVSSSFAGN